MTKHRIFIALLLTLLAATPRFYKLNQLGFSGDEELTAFAARSFRQEGRAQMPSGMSYYRAFPFTMMNVAALSFADEEKESSYRLVASLLGTATVPLTFLGAAPLLGGPAAFSGALLLALSKRHIGYSRHARMYTSFLFFSLLSIFLAWHWGKSGDRRIFGFSLLSAGVAATMHKLAFLLPLTAFLPMLLFPGFFSRARGRSVVGLTVALGVIMVGYEWLVDLLAKAGAARTELAVTLPGTGIDPGTVVARGWGLVDGGVLTLVGGLVGVGLGLWLARSLRRTANGEGSRVEEYWGALTGFFCGALTGIGFLYAAMVALVLFLIPQHLPAGRVLRKARLPLILLGGLALVNVLLDLAANPGVEGLRGALFFPFPIPLYFFQSFPGISILFAAALLFTVLKSCPAEAGTRMMVFAVVITFLVLGTLTEWTPFRYYFGAYPFILLGAAWGGLKLIQLPLQNLRPSKFHGPTLVLSLLILSGLLGGHGIPQALEAATASHEKPNTELEGEEEGVPADHKSAGEYVRARLAQGDVVVAEDATNQAWYTGGHVDYWLRDPLSHAMYTYVDGAGRRRDLYTNAEVADREVLESLCREGAPRVWVITSPETHGIWEFYLDDEQQEWLTDLMNRQEPELEGRDGQTRVYRIDCGRWGRGSSPPQFNHVP